METDVQPDERAWQTLIQRGMNPQERGDCTQCERCRRWSNVPCQCPKSEGE